MFLLWVFTYTQVALKFLLQLSPIVSVIPKSLKEERIRENSNLNFTLTAGQVFLFLFFKIYGE
jgi:diketogulonate reductase-like aldo/keto reductase